jgi:hypothetical protein
LAHHERLNVISSVLEVVFSRPQQIAQSSGKGSGFYVGKLSRSRTAPVDASDQPRIRQVPPLELVELILERWLQFLAGLL